jgi:uncharacterized membrane protein YqjE
VAAVLSILMLAVISLVAGAIYLWRRGASRLQVALMLVMALVMAVNVAIWTLPSGEGTAPLENELR